MREIKFRAWDKVNDIMFDVAMLSWLVVGLKVEDPASISEFQGDNCILMQYTGLKDKNGREIYEGDIIKIEDEWTEPILDFGQGPTEPCFHLAPIKYEDGAAAYIADINNGADFFSKGPHSLDEITKEGFEIEVIGNIYEDSHLLEGDK